MRALRATTSREVEATASVEATGAARPRRKIITTKKPGASWHPAS